MSHLLLQKQETTYFPLHYLEFINLFYNTGELTHNASMQALSPSHSVQKYVPGEGTFCDKVLRIMLLL